MKEKLITIILLLGILMLLVNIVHSWFNLAQKGDVVRQAQEKYSQVIQNYEELKRKKAQVESDYFIEQEARNKLNLGREGEVVLLLPSISPIEPSPVVVFDNSPNILKWFKIFF